MNAQHLLTSYLKIIISSPVMKNQSWNQSVSMVCAIDAIFVRINAACISICSRPASWTRISVRLTMPPTRCSLSLPNRWRQPRVSLKRSKQPTRWNGYAV